jgi:hypothetical protein
MAAREAHVVPATNGSWEVVEPGAQSPSSSHPTQRDAITSARKLLERGKGGEIVIHGRDGSIQQSDLVPGLKRRKRAKSTA